MCRRTRSRQNIPEKLIIANGTCAGCLANGQAGWAVTAQSSISHTSPRFSHWGARWLLGSSVGPWQKVQDLDGADQSPVEQGKRQAAEAVGHMHRIALSTKARPLQQALPLQASSFAVRCPAQQVSLFDNYCSPGIIHNSFKLI